MSALIRRMSRSAVSFSTLRHGPMPSATSSKFSARLSTAAVVGEEPNAAEMANGAEALLETIFKLAPEPKPIASVPEWWDTWHINDDVQRLPAFDRAVVGGFQADRLGYAFLAGYQCAVQKLFTEITLNHRLAGFAVSETGGGHPKAVLTTMTPGREGKWVLNGTKTFCLQETGCLLVVARDATATSEQGALRTCIVFPNDPGVSKSSPKSIPFIPEVEHCAVTLENVEVDEALVLQGDAYLNHVKPFRTVEDIHVTAATLGYLLQVTIRCSFPQKATESLLGAMCALRSLSTADPKAAETHVALAGSLTQTYGAIESLDEHWHLADATTRDQWQRDAPLMNIAGKVRDVRLKKAWQVLSPRKSSL